MAGGAGIFLVTGPPLLMVEARRVLLDALAALADLAIDPTTLAEAPPLAGAGRRGARLARHGKQAAGRAVGLEAALVDRSPITITSLDPTDTRAITVNVAGPAALLVAKLHKIGERTAQAERRPDRVIAKDAADSYRLMLHLGAEAAAAQFEYLLEHPVAGNPTRTALGYLEALFGTPAAAGVRLAVEGLSSDIPAD